MLKITLGTWMYQGEAFDLSDPLESLFPQPNNWLGVEFGAGRHEEDYFLHVKSWNSYATVEDTSMLDTCAKAEGKTGEEYLMEMFRTIIPTLPHLGTPVLREESRWE